MPTPIFALRLPQKLQDDLAEMARIYGAPNVRAFVKEILEVMTSGNTDRVKAFNVRLMQGVGEQLALKLNATYDASLQAMPARKERTARKPRRKRRPRDRTT